MGASRLNSSLKRRRFSPILDSHLPHFEASLGVHKIEAAPPPGVLVAEMGYDPHLRRALAHFGVLAWLGLAGALALLGWLNGHRAG